MSNELQISNMGRSLVPDTQSLNALSFMAKSANNSKFYNSLGGEAGILSIMLLARELDISPMQALSGGIWNIQGKVEMSARMMNMKIRQAGHKMKIESDAQKCVITGTRKDTSEELTITYTMEDANRAGLSGGNIWKKYPREMLFNRCLSIIARMLFPDVIGNCYVEGEIKEAIDVEDYEKKQARSKPIAPENLEVCEVQVSTPSIQEEEISTDEIRALIEALDSDENRLIKLLEFYKVERIVELSRNQFNEALRIATSKK